MILTSQEEYGLRCALTLARAQQAGHPGSPGDGALTLGQIASAEGMTSPYAGKLLRVLVQSGLIESTRGRSGGYSLTRPAAEIPVSAVLHGLGGKIYDGEICSTAPGGLCVHNNDCAIRSLWMGLQQLVDGYLSRTTLADLIGDESSVSKSMSNLVSSLPTQWG